MLPSRSGVRTARGSDRGVLVGAHGAVRRTAGHVVGAQEDDLDRDMQHDTFPSTVTPGSHDSIVRSSTTSWGHIRDAWCQSCVTSDDDFAR
jgi:hypothetical protein